MSRGKDIIDVWRKIVILQRLRKNPASFFSKSLPFGTEPQELPHEPVVNGQICIKRVGGSIEILVAAGYSLSYLEGFVSSSEVEHAKLVVCGTVK